MHRFYSVAGALLLAACPVRTIHAQNVQQMEHLHCVMQQEQKGVNRQTAEEACSQLSGAIASVMVQGASDIYSNDHLFQACIAATERATDPSVRDEDLEASFAPVAKQYPGCGELFTTAPNGIDADTQQACFRIANRRAGAGEKLIPTTCERVVARARREEALQQQVRNQNAYIHQHGINACLAAGVCH